jgi:hypothetical protein
MKQPSNQFLDIKIKDSLLHNKLIKYVNYAINYIDKMTVGKSQENQIGGEPATRSKAEIPVVREGLKDNLVTKGQS